mgnify:CR=1 FL=1
MKKYLPSKKFMYLLGSFAVIAIVFFLAFMLFSGKMSFSNKKEGKLSVDRLSMAGLTVSDLIKTDSDGDGVTDWEESLWGTDKNNPMSFDGITDSKYIESKKKELNIESRKEGEQLSETDIFAREFFASYVAMKASGEMDKDAINEFSNALGERLADPSIINQYGEKDLTIGSMDKKKYYTEIKTLFDKYRSTEMGDELSIISSGLTVNSKNGNEITTQKLINIANSYKDFANKAIKIMVPESLMEHHLKVINSANNIGESIESMSKISVDPIVGLVGLSQYQKYSEEFLSEAEELETKALE